LDGKGDDIGGEENVTKVTIEAHGHLGDFSREYFIEPGKEFTTTAKILKEFYDYVRSGYEKRWQELFKALEELEKIEKKETT